MPKQKDAIALLKEDHDLVKNLFEQFEDADEATKKAEIAKKAISELKIHDAIEEEIFYPQVRQVIDENGLMNEADEEHHMVRIAIAELDGMEGQDERFEAKFTVLSEMVRHHIKEEESEMFPKVKKSEVDLKTLGQQLQIRKEELKSQGVPATKEMEMVGAER